MGLFKDIKDGLTGNSDLSRLSEKDQEKIRKVRAEYELRVAESKVAAAADMEAELEGREQLVLHGPVELARYGKVLSVEDRTEQPSVSAALGAALTGTAKAIGDVAADLVGSVRSVSAGVSDPDERARIMRAEVAARSVAREPFRSAQRPDVRFTRIATRGATQVDQVVDALCSSGLAEHPELLYGMYRVPDRISPHRTKRSEDSRVVEWALVHEGPLPGSARSPQVRVEWIGVGDPWVRRAVGEPSVLAEELAVDLARRAEIADEQLLSVARVLTIQQAPMNGGVDDPHHDDPAHHVRLRGVVAVHTAAGARPFADMLAAAPIAHEPPSGLHVDVLNWGAIAFEVHPRPQDGPSLPSPWPHLPSTPEELATMYLEVVGVRAVDCVSVQSTSLGGQVEPWGGELMGGLAVPKLLPCADGTDRERFHAGSVVVVAYRDTPDYVEGRRRWRAHLDEVLFARLHLGTDHHAPVASPSALPGAIGRSVERWLQRANRVAGAAQGKRAGSVDGVRPVSWYFTDMSD